MSNQLTASAVSIIDDMKSELAPMLAENGQSFDRLRSVFMIAVQQEPDILKCTRESLRRELSKCAADGLVPDAKEAVLLPYKGKDDDDREILIANYQPMVHGVIKRLRELGGVFQIVCNLVYANDTYEENEADPDSLVHKSPGFGKPRGEVVGGYVIFRDEQKRVMHFEKMSLDDFRKVRQASKASNSPAWRNWTNEMYRKAVLRRGSKYLSTNNDKIRALIERTDSMFDFSRDQAVERIDPFGGPTIEHEKQSSSERSSQAQKDEGGGAAGQGNKTPPPPPMEVPEVSIAPMDADTTVEACTKLLAIPLDPKLDPVQKRQTLKSAAASWKEAVPDDVKPLLRACIDMSDWAIKSQDASKPWTGDHAVFVNKVKTLLGVEKLEIGKYPS